MPAPLTVTPRTSAAPAERRRALTSTQPEAVA